MKVWKRQQLRLGLLKVGIGLVGLLMSIVLHELFHIAMHWGEITRIDILPDRYTLAQVIVELPQGENLIWEETMAYGITLLVMVATVILIGRVHDKADDKSFSELLFPGDPDSHKLVELAYRSRLL